MRIGLLARCDNRGIAFQTHEFYRHMKPAQTLVLCLSDPLWPEDTSRYNHLGVDFVSVGPDRIIDERKAKKLLRGVDVVFAVETLMDWRIADWAREMGVRTVVQGNPEFYAPDRYDYSPPDLWAWPTNWMVDQLPEGIILPVPTPDDCMVVAAHPQEGPLKVLHVAGHAAAGDRNGTINFMESLQFISQQVVVTVVGQDHWLPRASRLPKNVELYTLPDGVENRWLMYSDQHVVVLPRKYGGLCLPAQEACRVGCAVVMPNCIPNDTWPGPRIPARKGRLHRAPSGRIQTYDVDPHRIALQIDTYAKNRDVLMEDMIEAHIWGMTNTWGMWKQRYEEALS
jgi:hypothetical protein